MLEEIMQIAMRIRDLREIAGMSVKTLAEEFNIDKETYLSYESGNEDIPVSFLSKIAHKFNVELAEILTGQNPKLHVYSLVRNAQGVSAERRQEYHYQHLAYNFANEKIEPFIVTVAAKPESTPIKYNTHPGQEFNYVLEGQLQVIIDNHELILEEGDSLLFDSGHKHGMRALGGKAAKFLAVIA